MNPWDNFVIALRIAWPGYLIGFILVLTVRLWIYREGHRLPSEDFTDQRYEDGFFVQTDS